MTLSAGPFFYNGQLMNGFAFAHLAGVIQELSSALKSAKDDDRDLIIEFSPAPALEYLFENKLVDEVVYHRIRWYFYYFGQNYEQRRFLEGGDSDPRKIVEEMLDLCGDLQEKTKEFELEMISRQ